METEDVCQYKCLCPVDGWWSNVAMMINSVEITSETPLICETKYHNCYDNNSNETKCGQNQTPPVVSSKINFSNWNENITPEWSAQF